MTDSLWGARAAVVDFGSEDDLLVSVHKQVRPLKVRAAGQGLGHGSFRNHSWVAELQAERIQRRWEVVARYLVRGDLEADLVEDVERSGRLVKIVQGVLPAAASDAGGDGAKHGHVPVSLPNDLVSFGRGAPGG